MEYRDYYKILGVDKNADEKEIKRAYRRLARQYHPDVNPGNKQAEERFKEINEAYEVLSDPEKRRKYDQLGANWQAYQRTGADPSGFDWSQWMAGGPGGSRVRVEVGDIEDLFGESGFSDFFQAIFGGGGFRTATGARARPQARRGRDVEQPVQITLEEAFHGTQRILSIDGRRLEVKIPPGVRTGSRVRVAGEGYPGAGDGPAGDLYLVVEVLPHPIFERDGDDLRCEVPISLTTAVLGGEVTVPTLTGRGVLRIPEGTQPGQVFRLRGQGMPNLRNPNERGNLLVKVKVQLPEKLTEEQRRLFRQLASLEQRS
ncbi:MAG: DnaJ domain-containing protein [Caldilineales bacterium]|nr:DnaJ domain-containing protein [Caldilineales bacterium]MDW8316523.1 DnaJ C-terminal domain-containing protein [Anaerolineae bacterium]